ncbi:MAG: Rieske 2Fe-2S domain-containing protein, partial [Chloroflexota bacterium]|nr:Rieske 2Fe-2S domain-containing protein [Chloroflexota bacterium]
MAGKFRAWGDVMLSAEDNALLTEVGPGKPMGELLRRYWLPAMLSDELPEPDCPPVKLRLLGEDLVAFRATSGRVGVLDTWCPHRNANLYWGRNEEEGLRCVYHGWKFDAEGSCVDMPNEPPGSRFAEKIRQPAYRAIDRAGIIWVHMGPRELAPEIPDLPFMHVPASHRNVSKRMQMCNYLQNLEGEVDSSHVSFLHSTLGPEGMRAVGDNWDRHPVFQVKETDFGLAVCARRDAGPAQYYWRITPFMLPSFTVVPRLGDGSYIFTGAVPVDDTTMIGMTVFWNPDREVAGGPGAVDVDERFNAVQNKGNDYLIDRQDQKTNTWTGIQGIRVQDMAVQEDQRGPISDRTREHLGTTDLGVIATRRLLLKQIRDLQQGIEPPQPHNPRAFHVRSLAANANRSIGWE